MTSDGEWFRGTRRSFYAIAGPRGAIRSPLVRALVGPLPEAGRWRAGSLGLRARRDVRAGCVADSRGGRRPRDRRQQTEPVTEPPLLRGVHAGRSWVPAAHRDWCRRRACRSARARWKWSRSARRGWRERLQRRHEGTVLRSSRRTTPPPGARLQRQCNRTSCTGLLGILLGRRVARSYLAN